MFDIRDHGGHFGSGKYRKGSVIPISDLGIPSLPYYDKFDVAYFPGSSTVYLWDFLYFPPPTNRLVVAWRYYVNGYFYSVSTYNVTSTDTPDNAERLGGINTSYHGSYCVLIDLGNSKIMVFDNGHWDLVNRDTYVGYASGNFSWDTNNARIQFAIYNGFLVATSGQYVNTVNISTYAVKNMSNLYVQWGVDTSFCAPDGYINAVERDGQMLTYNLSYWKVATDGLSITRQSYRTYTDTDSRNALGAARFDQATKFGFTTYVPSNTKLLRIDGSNITSIVDIAKGAIYKLEVTDITKIQIYTKQTINQVTVYKLITYNQTTNGIVSEIRTPNMAQSRPFSATEKMMVDNTIMSNTASVDRVLTGITLP